MRKTAFIISMSLITVLLTGHFFIYKGVLKAHKKEFKAFIRSNFVRSEQLEIDPSQLYRDNAEMQWLDENKEVCLNGMMYDILSIKNAGTKVILNVVKDKDEKELMDRYRDQFNDQYENSKSGKKGNTILKDLLSLKYLADSSLKQELQTQHVNFTTVLDLKIQSVYLNVQTPPPLV